MAKSTKAPRKKAAAASKTTVNAVAAKAPTTPKKPAVAEAFRGLPKSKATKEADPSGPRRTIFIDVENTSGEAALLAALDQLEIDRTAMSTELVAVGNWRVIGQHVARLLAQRGARLLHTAPATGVKDWSDLSIAVAAGIWLGRARAGDQVEIVSADRAFDAVADAAAHLGVKFRRLTYGSVSGLAEAIAVDTGQAPDGSRRRSRRGGRSRRGRTSSGWSPSAPAIQRTLPAADLPTPVHVVASNGGGEDIHGASPDQIVSMIARLTARAPERGVNLDLLINALKAEGFGRPAGSPRLVTRLRKMKDVDVSPTGMVRLVPGTIVVPPSEQTPVMVEPPVEAPVEAATEPVAAESADGTAKKKPRRRGGRGRRRPSAKATAAAAASEAAEP